MKTNFLNLVAYDPIATQSGAKMPQNTGGGNSQTKRATLALPLRYLCAMLLALFVGVGQMWGETWDVSLTGSGMSKDGITLTGDYIANAQVGNNSQKANSFNTNNSSAYIFSESTNITGVSFRVCRASNGSSASAAVNVATSTGAVFAIPTSSGFTATNNGTSINSLSGVTAVGNNQTADNTVAITFTNPVKAVELRKQSASNIHDIVITYTKVTAPTEIFKAVITGQTAKTVDPKPDAAADMTISLKSNVKTISDNKYHQWDGDNTIDFGAAKFQVGDQILVDVCGSGNNKTVGFLVNSGEDEHTIILSATAHGEVCYTVKAGDGVVGESSVTLKRKSSDTYVHSFRVLRATPAATYNATFANGGHGTPPTAATGVSSVTLTEITGVDGWKNTGWTADKATKVGTTDKAAGTTLNIGDEVTLLENTTFTAQWAKLYTVTYNKAAGEEGDVPTQVPLVDGSTFDVAGSGSLYPPTPGQVFRGWDDGIAAEPYKAGDEYTIAGENVNFTAVWGATTSYTITLDAKGGTIASYDSWTKVGDVYSKTLVEGTTVPLLAFTKADVQLMFFRDGSANEYSGSVTLNSDMNLSAVWGEEKEVELYYWEGKEGGAIERGGTAVSVDKDGNPTAGNADVNASVSPYYTIRVQGKYDYSNPYVKITTDESVKTGDKITFTGFINKNQEKDAAMLMKAGDKVLFAETTSLPNIAYPAETPGTPEEREYTISTTDVDATVLDLMRNNGHSGTNCFVTKLAITGTRVVEVKDPCETPTITVQPVGGTYNWNQDASQSVTASVEDGGTLKYQWYKKGTPDAKVGTNSNAFTPTESGTYYVIVTNTKAGYGDADKKSNEVAVTIIARPSYKVAYYDGSTKIGEEDVLEDANPAEYEAKQAKAHYNFVAWYNNNDLAEEHKIANIAALSITGGINVYGKWTPLYAETVDFSSDTYVKAEKVTKSLETIISENSLNYTCGGTFDKSEWGTTGESETYQGYKFKDSGVWIEFLLKEGKRATVLFGNYGKAMNVTIGSADPVSATLTDSKYVINAAEDVVVRFTTTGTNTVTLKTITIADIPAESDDATLSDLKVGGATVEGFAAGTINYYVELPYGSTSQPAVTATPNDEHVTSVVIAQTLASLDDATITVTAEDGIHNKVYTVHFTVAPKLGVELIKATHTGTTTASKEGYWTADVTVDKKTQSKKMGANDDYFGLTLAGGKTFKNNDIVVIYLDPTQNPSAWLQLFKDKGTNMIADVQSGVKKGANYITLTGLPEEGIDKLYLYRTSTAAGNMNPYVDYIAVYRLMAPFIESFEVAGVDATIEGTAISAEVPAVTDVTALTPTVKFWANGGGSIDKTTAQNFTNPVTYTVSSSYADDATGAYAPVTYTVTVTKAAASSDATLSALTVNGQAVALVDGVYAYDVELPYGTTVAPTVEATAHHAGAVATVDPCTLSGATITVVPESGAGDQKVYTLTFTISAWKEVAIWDGSYMTAVKTSPDELTGLAWAVNGFSSLSNYAVSYEGKDYTKCLPSGGSASATRNIALTVPAGYVAKFYVVGGSHSDDEERSAFIATSATKTDTHEGILTIVSPKRVDLAGGTSAIVGEGTYYLNPAASFDFYEIRAYLRKGYVRTSMLGNGVLGTVCVDHNVAIEDIQGATFYELKGREPEYGKLAFDEIVSGELEAGAPYVFQAHGDKLVLFYGNTKVDDPVNKGNGMYGTFVAQTLTELDGIYYFAQKALWSCVDLTSLSLPANRAYVKLSEIDYLGSSTPLPGRKRMLIGVNGAPAVATGVENAAATDKPAKMLINGQLFILRGEKMYDAKGQLVK